MKFPVAFRPRSLLSAMTMVAGVPDHLIRSDGVRITHDPYAPGMAEKYGAPGKTDNEGFDPYADTVGPGIYGGIVKRDDQGQVVIGEQYQNHNPRPGPVYVRAWPAPPPMRTVPAHCLDARHSTFDHRLEAGTPR